MRFKEFLQIAELQGQFGNVSTAGGELGLIRKQIQNSQPVKNRGTTVSRMLSAGPKLTTPARPAGFSSHKKPMTIPSHLG